MRIFVQHLAWARCAEQLNGLTVGAKVTHPTMTAKMQLLGILAAQRWQWDTMLAQIDSESMAVPAAAGNWSVKNMISHKHYQEHQQDLQGWIELQQP